jgi:RNA polymerase sigma-70 factor (ECF subfamily)
MSASRGQSHIQLYTQSDQLPARLPAANDPISHIWTEFTEQLRSFIARRVRDEQEVEDILQDVFLKIHANLPQLRNQDRLQAWVYQITRNAITDHYRRQEKTPETTGEDFEDLAEEVTPSEVQTEVAGWLQPMMTELPEKYRQALLLTDIQGLTQQQLADQLDLSLSGAKSRVQRAREKLKDVLLGCCHLEFDRLGRVREYQFKEPSCRFCGEEAKFKDLPPFDRTSVHKDENP